MNPAKRYERGSNWSEPEVVELLQLWSDAAVQAELESCLRNQHVFKRIAAALNSRGVYRTADQCREKIKKLKLEYRRVKEKRRSARGARGRAWKFYEVMDRVLSGRALHHQPHLLPALNPTLAAFSCSSASLPSLTFSQPPHPGELLEIKREELHAEEEEEGEPEIIYHITSEDEHEPDPDPEPEPELETKLLEGGLLAEELENTTRGEITSAGAAVIQTTSSPSGFSDHNVAGSSGAAISPAITPMMVTDGAILGDTEAPKSSDLFRERKRRRAGRGMGSGRLLERALADFLGWQQVMEERYLSLEEARLQQEERAEERRERQQERQAQQNREHELHLLSLFTGALTAARGTADSISISTSNLEPAPAISTAVSESASLSGCPPSPDPEPRAEDSTIPFTPTMLKSNREPQHSSCLSRRGIRIQQHQGILQEGYSLYHANKHEKNNNPDGIINLGTSENKLCSDLLLERLSRPDMLHMEPSLLEYPDWKGRRFLREEVAKFLSQHCRSPSPLQADNVVVMNGCTSLFCALATVLCDPEDAILIPTPFYGVIREDVDFYSGVKLYCLPLDSEARENDDRPFHLTAEKLERALERAKKEGVNIRAVILVNPHNPLGDIYTAEEMTSFLNFAKRHELHAIVDEIYMLSVFDENQSFHSVLSLQRLPDPQRTHVMWGLSKDFALSGVRVGTLYSENEDLVQALDQVGNFHGIAGSIQHQVAQLMRDTEWVNGVFLLENRRRLKEAHKFVATQLILLGIPYLDRGSGFFIWADFSKYLKEPTFMEELRVWRCFLKHKVLLSCGQAFSCSSPGWFRIIFSDQQYRLELGLQRIRTTLEELKGSNNLPVWVNTKEDKQESRRQTEHTAETEGEKHEDNATAKTTSAFNTPTKVHCEGNGSGSASILLADGDTVVFNCQSSSTSESLESLIGALRQQIQTSDWLEKNRPELADGEDPAQLDVFKDLLDRARI